MCISNPIPVTVSLGKCSNLITVSVKDNFTLANTVTKGEKNVCQYIGKKRIAFTVTTSFIRSCTKKNLRYLQKASYKKIDDLVSST